jgi:hypothetical protein
VGGGSLDEDGTTRAGRRARSLSVSSPAGEVLAGATSECVLVDNDDMTATEGYEAIAFRSAEHAVRGRARRTSHRGDNFLAHRERDVVVAAGELLDEGYQSAKHPRFDRHEERFKEMFGRASQTLGQRVHQEIVEVPIAGAEPGELGGAERARLDQLQRNGGRRPSCVVRKQRAFTEQLAGPENTDGRDVPERCRHTYCDPAFFDHVHGVANVVRMEDHLAPTKSAARCTTQQLRFELSVRRTTTTHNTEPIRRTRARKRADRHSRRNRREVARERRSTQSRTIRLPPNRGNDEPAPRPHAHSDEAYGT